MIIAKYSKITRTKESVDGRYENLNETLEVVFRHVEKSVEGSQAECGGIV